MKQRQKVMWSAVVLLAGIAAWWWLRSAPLETGEAALAASNPPSRSPRIEDESGAVAASPSSPSPQARSRLTTHAPEQWNDFILPSVDITDLSLTDALAVVVKAYQEACLLSHERALKLEFTVTGAPEHPISCSLKGKSLTAVMNHLAALAGLKMRHEGLHMEFFRPSDSSDLTETNFRTDGGSRQQIKERQMLGAMLDSGESMETLRKTGILRDISTKLVKSEDGSIRFRGTQSELARLQSWLSLESEPMVQLKFTNQQLVTKEPLDLPAQVLDDTQLRQLLKDASTGTGNHLTTAPSVTARDGQNATIEMIRETDQNGISSWNGVRYSMSASRTGLKVVGKDQSEFRPAPGAASSSGWVGEADVVVYPGQHQIERVSARKGEYQYRIVGMTTMNEAGRPLNSDESVSPSPPVSNPITPGEIPIAAAIPEAPGMVYSPFNQKVVDVRDIPSGTLVQDPSFPAADKKYFRVP
jgi:hypothetical protein